MSDRITVCNGPGVKVALWFCSRKVPPLAEFWEKSGGWLVWIACRGKKSYIGYSGVVDHFELDAGVEGVEQCLEGKGRKRSKLQKRIARCNR